MCLTKLITNNIGKKEKRIAYKIFLKCPSGYGYTSAYREDNNIFYLGKTYKNEEFPPSIVCRERHYKLGRLYTAGYHSYRYLSTARNLIGSLNIYNGWYKILKVEISDITAVGLQDGYVYVSQKMKLLKEVE